MTVLAEELLTFSRDELTGFMYGCCDKRAVADAIVENFEELKRLRGIEVKRPPHVPGPMQVRLLPGGDGEMPKVVATFPPDPTPTITDPDLVPVSQTFWATVGGVEVAREDALPMTATACQPVAVDAGPAGGPGVELVLNLTYADKDGMVSAPKTQTVAVPAAPAAPVNLPPNAPGDFGGVQILPDTP